MKLTGWDIDIISDTEYNKMRKGEIETQDEGHYRAHQDNQAIVKRPTDERFQHSNFLS